MRSHFLHFRCSPACPFTSPSQWAPSRRQSPPVRTTPRAGQEDEGTGSRPDARLAGDNALPSREGRRAGQKESAVTTSQVGDEKMERATLPPWCPPAGSSGHRGFPGAPGPSGETEGDEHGGRREPSSRKGRRRPRVRPTRDVECGVSRCFSHTRMAAAVGFGGHHDRLKGNGRQGGRGARRTPGAEAPGAAQAGNAASIGRPPAAEGRSAAPAPCWRRGLLCLTRVRGDFEAVYDGRVRAEDREPLGKTTV